MVYNVKRLREAQCYQNFLIISKHTHTHTQLDYNLKQQHLYHNGIALPNKKYSTIKSNNNKHHSLLSSQYFDGGNTEQISTIRTMSLKQYIQKK